MQEEQSLAKGRLALEKEVEASSVDWGKLLGIGPGQRRGFMLQPRHSIAGGRVCVPVAGCQLTREAGPSLDLQDWHLDEAMPCWGPGNDLRSLPHICRGIRDETVEIVDGLGKSRRQTRQWEAVATDSGNKTLSYFDVVCPRTGSSSVAPLSVACVGGRIMTCNAPDQWHRYNCGTGGW